MGAASSAIRSILLAAPAPGVVLAAVPAALYVQVGHGDAGREAPRHAEPGGGPSDDAADAPGVHPAVIAVLAQDAVRLPIGLVLPDAAAARPFAGIAAGDGVRAGGGAVSCAGRTWRVLRWWDPALHPVRGPVGAPAARNLAVPVPDPVLAAPTEALGRALECSGRARPDPRQPDGAAPDAAGPDGAGLDAAVRGLVGLGPGLTPAGDDVLCGALAGLAAAGDRERHAALAAAVLGAAGRTTVISAALLRHACAGAAIPQLAAFLDAVLRGATPDRTAAATRALIAVGHTSGAALAHGALLGVGAAGGKAPGSAVAADATGEEAA